MPHRLLGAAACVLALAVILPSGLAVAQEPAGDSMDPALARGWMQRWRQNILATAARNRYCDKEMGEEIGWLVSPFLNGFYYGYMATGDREWVDHLIDWTDSVIKRGVKEPDGYIGWPKDETPTSSITFRPARSCATRTSRWAMRCSFAPWS